MFVYISLSESLKWFGVRPVKTVREHWQLLSKCIAVVSFKTGLMNSVCGSKLFVSDLCKFGFSETSSDQLHIDTSRLSDWNITDIFLLTCCLQCFDAVGWAAGRACKKQSGGVLAWSFCSEVQIVCIWSSWCHCIPKSHRLLPHFNPDCFLAVSYTHLTLPTKRIV